MSNFRRSPGPPSDPDENSLPDLPARITSIRPQKKRRDRFSLFSDNTFLLGVSSYSLTEFNLGKGTLLTEPLYRRIMRREESVAVRDYLLRLLGRRDHTRLELKRKARSRRFSEDLTEEKLDEFERKGYLDERHFARKFADEKISVRQWGPIRIRRELQKKGVHRTIIDDVLAEHDNRLELEQICVDLAMKRSRHFMRESDLRKRKARIAGYLQRKGYRFETIKTALPEIMRRLNDS